ncbi:hypothetical protein Smp_157860 [Schistosoma mansoni]|uniref:hypothetical protein n=1 Tax=Schistosoma mansoni TaxID=6183 RepID=UPI0001A62364|nr:hypothetical protein Smp_157860 [Schistosoma mansoni]|eukprot:XP_018654897.1 hypothetical protein Smp_157860 [Schistosoma mansoni]
MTIKGHEMDNTLHMDESVDNENYIGDSCDNLDDDNISFTSNDLSQKVNHHEHEHEHQDTRDQHQFNVQQQQQNSPYNLENEDGPETHNSDEISSNINMTDIKMDTMEDIEKDDNSMNTYQVNSKQQFNDNQSSNCHRQLTKINKLSNSSTSISTSTNTTTTTKACAKKSFVWKYFHHPEIKHGIPDRSRTQCVLCDSQLAFNASGTTTTMLNHLKSRHGEIAEQEETLRRLNRDSRKNQLRNMILSSNDCKLSPTSINSNSTIIKNNEMINSFNENTQTIRNLSTNLINGNNKYNRGTLSVGQRGRPPGSGRRQKSMNCSKLNENVDFLNQDTITNGNLKAEGNAVYPVTNYQTTLSDQQKAFLNEMLLSAAAAVSASTVSVSKSDNRLNGSFINQTSSPAATSSPSFFASPTLLGQLPSNDSNPTKSPFTLLNNITGLPNIPFQLPVNTPQINCSSGTTTSIPTSGIHELSPSSSSGLGLSSVNSPFETSTITVTTLANTVFMSSPSSSSSPTNSLGYRSITSPGGCSSGGQSNINIRNNLLSNMRTTHKSQEFNHLHTNNILMNGQSLNLMDSCNSGSQEVTNLPLNMQNITQDKEKFLNLSNENNENIFNLTQLNKTPNSSTILSTGINNNSINSLPMLNCPSDMMMSALGSFVHLMPSVNNLLTETTTNNFTNSSMNNGTTMNRIDEINQSNHFTNQLSKSMLQSISPQHHHQHQQQLLMANAWLTNLTNGKFSNYPNNLIDPYMRSNNQLMNDKYSSIEQQMINSSLYSSTNYTVSTKRKRSRPVYISPEKELKRSSIEFNQSFDGEDMKMKRYHTEKTNLSINNHNNSDSCIDDKKSCWKIKQNVQNISEHKLLSLFTNHKLPTIKEISEITFPELYTEIEDHLNELLDNRMIQSNSFNPAFSFSIELWNTINNDNNNSNLSKDCIVTENKQQFANIGIHYNSSQPTITHNYLYKSIQNPNRTNLLEVMDKCRQRLLSKLQLTTNENMSGISSTSLEVGLNTDIIRNLIKNLLKVYQCKTMKNITEYSVNKLSLDEVKKSNCCKAVYDLLNWYLNEYSVDKDNSENNNHEIIINGDKENTNENDLDEIDLQNVKGIISVFDTIGQTLEFIHKKDLILTGSMIKPILTNLCDIRLAHESSNLTIVEEFKSTIVSYLMNSFPNNGAVYETLWIASLLDPRFKSQVQDKKPTVIKLLRMKVDAMFTQSPTSNVCNNTPKSNSDNHLPTETTTSSVDSTTISNKHSGLETVFGLNYFPRTSLSEVDRYLREDPIGLEEDPYQWWQTKSSNYPNLSLLAMYYLAISLICITPERLKSLDHSEANNQSIPDIKLNLLTSIYGSKNKGQFPSTSLLLLDLPNINDVFGQGRLNIHNDNQIMYNYLWHNWHLTKFV